mmetsp:Transcript_3250/g.10213  ORF Transcript_3250/g.10213 Transcript_3250/m.10213 type:complete len:430 (+) Transcript_3250:1017-2306(+)
MLLLSVRPLLRQKGSPGAALLAKLPQVLLLRLPPLLRLRLGGVRALALRNQLLLQEPQLGGDVATLLLELALKASLCPRGTLLVQLRVRRGALQRIRGLGKPSPGIDQLRLGALEEVLELADPADLLGAPRERQPPLLCQPLRGRPDLGLRRGAARAGLVDGRLQAQPLLGEVPAAPGEAILQLLARAARLGVLGLPGPQLAPQRVRLRVDQLDLRIQLLQLRALQSKLPLYNLNLLLHSRGLGRVSIPGFHHGLLAGRPARGHVSLVHLSVALQVLVHLHPHVLVAARRGGQRIARLPELALQVGEGQGLRADLRPAGGARRLEARDLVLGLVQGALVLPLPRKLLVQFLLIAGGLLRPRTPLNEHGATEGLQPCRELLQLPGSTRLHVLAVGGQDGLPLRPGRALLLPQRRLLAELPRQILNVSLHG